MNRKFTAAAVFNGYQFLPDGWVVVTKKDGEILDIVPMQDAGEGVEVIEGLLLPGFINAHCHLELSHLAGVVAEGTGLVDFVQVVMSRRASEPELMLDTMRQAAATMYDNGIVAVGDICNTVNSIPVKRDSALLWHNFLEVSGFVHNAAEARLQAMQAIQQQFITALPQQISTLSPHAPYSVSRPLFQRLNEYTPQQVVTIHNQEAAAENQLYVNKKGDFLQLYSKLGIPLADFEPSGTTSFQTWLPYFDKQQTIIAVHNTFTSEADIRFAEQLTRHRGQQLFYCLCPNANLYIEKQLPPVDLLRQRHCQLIIGTDSYASNHHLSILEELKTLQAAGAGPIPLAEMLQWATANGAAALQLNNVGSFEKGKTPGIVQLYPLEGGELGWNTRANRIL